MSVSRPHRAALLALCLALPAAHARADAPSDPAALLDALRASHDPVRQNELIDAVIRRAGQAGADQSALRAAAPKLMLAIVQEPANDWSVRGEAMAALRALRAPDDIVGQAIEAARADTGEHAGYLHGQALALQNWRDSRDNSAGMPAATPQDAERRARLYLRQRNLDVSFDALTDAVGKGQTEIVAALLTAGLKVGGDQAERADMAVVNALATACGQGGTPPDGVAHALSLLASQGLAINRRDESGNTMLMSAAQFCPAPIVSALLALGADPTVVNKQQFTPLQMALVSGKWDVAEVLVDHGARITSAQAKQLFFEPPTKPAQRDLLARATR